MSDSESDREHNSLTPSDQSLEQSLRDEVAKVFKSGKMEELTVKRVRLAAEKSLGLAEGYFKTTGDWKTRSEKIIKDEVEKQEAAPEEPREEVPHEPQPKKKAAPKRSKSDAAPKPRKRQKTQTPESEDDLAGSPVVESEEESTKPKQGSTAKAKKGAKSKEREVSVEAADAPNEDIDMEDKPTESTADLAKDDSESEMSVVLDEEPEPAPKKRKSAKGPAKKGRKTAKPPPKEKDEQDPDQAEIKRLQGWLVKCGIRKMWFRELAPYETPKAKIKHLKDMLEEAGMTGRYSQEKANKIREERELKADLEQIQQGAQQWGDSGGSRRRTARGQQPLKVQDDDDNNEESEEETSQKRIPRGRQSLAFLDDEDGEESD
ncbi:hypothetical protein N7468_009551 [Penicillium chermesinum]|uniref:Transcriptional regulator n=1 Tax=Penicillium chermesinum TaxID=63820 RepID=A0A9W9NI20_9EURO|nr:uncharacterized protein N7468_009551 [Penicillium chermesinum]KAJ5220347.1 hypothetical protein N7468_009551 [Penicillium chermesinum]KAJ6157790.1 hypothetical protein N7470_005382 [Penicillium chermesinum]